MIVSKISILFLIALIIPGCWSLRSSEKQIVVLNVLDKALYDDCHIPGSVQVDFDKVDRYISAYPKDSLIVVYCSNYACMTSHFVVKKLRAKGYINARVYAGGMAEWFLAGYPVEGSAQEPYLHKEVMPEEGNLDEIPKIDKKELAELLKIVYNSSHNREVAA